MSQVFGPRPVKLPREALPISLAFRITAAIARLARLRVLHSNRYTEWANRTAHLRRAQVVRVPGVHPCACLDCQRFEQLRGRAP